MGNKFGHSPRRDQDHEVVGGKRKRSDDDDGSDQVQAACPGSPDKLNTWKRKKTKSTSKYIYQTLFLDGEGSDVTIRALDKDWKLHKLYLKQSSYFSSMFTGSWKESSMAKIDIEILDENITEESLKIAFGSLYKDDILIKPLQVVGVLAAATLLQMDSLIKHCSAMMSETLSSETVCTYYAASISYGLVEIADMCMTWLTKNILITDHVAFMSEINIDLMKSIVSSPHLFVMQVEIDVYTMLKKWIYLRHRPDWSGDSKELIKCSESYFKDKMKDTTKCFLESDEGKHYIPVFAEIRWHYVINDMASIKNIETDRILPITWLEPMFLYGWRRVLQIEQGLYTGPVETISDTVFDEACSRCGRILKKTGEYCWRWVGYNYGVDLLISLNNRLLTVKRNTHSLQCSQAVSLMAEKHLAYRLTVSSIQPDGKEKHTKTTGIKKISLGKDEDEIAMLIDKEMEYPLAISMNVVMLSPMPEMPIPKLKVPEMTDKSSSDKGLFESDLSKRLANVPDTLS